MWTLSQWGCLVSLCGLSVWDLWRRQLPTVVLLLLTMTALGTQVFLRRIDFWLFLGGIAVGIFFFLVSKMTRGNFGYGDSWAILILGMMLGFWELLEVLAGALVFLFLASLLVLCRRKMSRKVALPFLPFLTGGYFLYLLSEGGVG